MKIRLRVGSVFALFSVAIVLGMFCGVGYAQQSSSTHFQVNEVFFGTGGELNACSTTYCSKQSAGELTVGNTKGNAFQAQAGFNTDRTPWIELGVEGSPDLDVGILSTAHANVGTSQFVVKSYLSSGYVVQTWGGPPKNGARALNGVAGDASAPGTEQFGINLAVNSVAGAMTGPISAPVAMTNFGAIPTQDPDSTFSFGAAATGYDTSNIFRYVDGDTIAQSTSSSGYTHYTVSYLFNVSETTPGGVYAMNHVLVATATF